MAIAACTHTVTRSTLIIERACETEAKECGGPPPKEVEHRDGACHEQAVRPGERIVECSDEVHSEINRSTAIVAVVVATALFVVAVYELATADLVK